MTLRLYLKSMQRLLLSSLVLVPLATCQVQNFQFPRMGGSYYATSFAHWQASTSTPVTAPGLATVQVIPAKVTLVANDQITPVTVGVPIQIEGGETVTPVSVSCNAQVCAMTATFAQAHPGGFTFASASDGLDEAIATAAAQGGGTVVVGTDWSGTTAQLAATAGNAAVAVLDTRAGASVRYTWTGSAYQAAVATFANGGLQAVGPALTPTSIEGVEYAEQFKFSASAEATLTASTFDVITPGWSNTPAGVASGLTAVISATYGSPTIGLVANVLTGAGQFNPNWVNKPIDIQGTAYTIASCLSATICTLTANFAGTHGTEGVTNWFAVVGKPDEIYLSGGTGTAEAMQVLGIGAAECPGGTALSICGVPANSHSGTISVTSATSGKQEAINSLPPAGGRVYVPAGNYTDYGTTVLAFDPAIITGPGGRHSAAVITDAVSGGDPAILLLGENDTTVENLTINGSAATGNLVSIEGVTDAFQARDSLRNLNLNASTGTGAKQICTGTCTSFPTGAAAGIYSAGSNDLTLAHNASSTNAFGWINGANGGLGCDACDVYGNSFGGNSEGGVLFAGTLNANSGISVYGNRSDFNGGPGWDFEQLMNGGSFAGNYSESNSAGLATGNQLKVVAAFDMSFTGNIFSMTPADGDVAILMASTLNGSTGIVFSGNQFLVHGAGSHLTTLFSGNLHASTIGPNGLQSGSTIEDGIVLNSGSDVQSGQANLLANTWTITGAGTLTNPIVDNTTGFTSASTVAGHTYMPPALYLASPTPLDLIDPTANDGEIQFQSFFDGGASNAETNWFLNTSTTPTSATRVQFGSERVRLDSSACGSWHWYGLNTSLQQNMALSCAGALSWGGGGSLATSNSTGSGSIVLSASPTLTGTPVLPATYSTGGYNIAQPASAGTLALSSQLPLTGSLAGSTTSLAAGSCGNAVTATVPGATTSMVATASGEGALPSAGLVLQAAVTSANTVTVEYCNVTTAAIVPAALTIAVRVIQ